MAENPILAMIRRIFGRAERPAPQNYPSKEDFEQLKAEIERWRSMGPSFLDERADAYRKYLTDLRGQADEISKELKDQARKAGWFAIIGGGITAVVLSALWTIFQSNLQEAKTDCEQTQSQIEQQMDQTRNEFSKEMEEAVSQSAISTKVKEELHNQLQNDLNFQTSLTTGIEVDAALSRAEMNITSQLQGETRAANNSLPVLELSDLRDMIVAIRREYAPDILNESLPPKRQDALILLATAAQEMAGGRCQDAKNTCDDAEVMDHQLPETPFFAARAIYLTELYRKDWALVPGEHSFSQAACSEIGEDYREAIDREAQREGDVHDPEIIAAGCLVPFWNFRGLLLKSEPQDAALALREAMKLGDEEITREKGEIGQDEVDPSAYIRVAQFWRSFLSHASDPQFASTYPPAWTRDFLLGRLRQASREAWECPRGRGHMLAANNFVWYATHDSSIPAEPTIVLPLNDQAELDSVLSAVGVLRESSSVEQSANLLDTRAEALYSLARTKPNQQLDYDDMLKHAQEDARRAKYLARIEGGEQDWAQDLEMRSDALLSGTWPIRSVPASPSPPPKPKSSP